MEKTSKGGPKPKFDWPKLQDGKWRVFRWKADAKKGENAFSCQLHSFVSLLGRRAKADGLGVETKKRGITKVRFRFTHADGTPIAQEAEAAS